jgi:hypothetical protein
MPGSLVTSYSHRMYDGIFQDQFADMWEPIAHSCTEDLFRSFGMIHDELWRPLLQKKFSAYPRIKSVLPDWPGEQLQRNWVGNCGEALDTLSFGFIRNLKSAYLATVASGCRIRCAGLWSRLGAAHSLSRQGCAMRKS